MDPRIDKEERAYLLLQWASLSPLAPFDEELAEAGFYTSVQKQRSDQALNAWDKENPYEQGAELKAFHELERRGFYTQADFFSADKAGGCVRWIDPNDPSKGEHSTCLTYTKELNALNKQSAGNKNNQNTDRRNDSGISSMSGWIQRTGISDRDQGRPEVPRSTDRQGKRRSYRRGSKRTGQPNS